MASTYSDVGTYSFYQRRFPQYPQAVDVLFSRQFVDTLRDIVEIINCEFTKEELIEEFRRLLIIKVHMRDTEDMIVGQTVVMETLWTRAIEDTKFYAYLQNGLGLILHRRPLKAGDYEERMVKTEHMATFYVLFFGMRPLNIGERERQHVMRYRNTEPQSVETVVQPAKPVAPPITVSILMAHNGRTIKIETRISDTIEEVKEKIKAQDTSPGTQILVFSGQILGNNKTLEECRITNGVTLHLLVRPVA